MGPAFDIVFLCSRLDQPGGTERAIINTANLLYSKGHRVAVLVLDETAASFFPLDRGIHLFHEHLHFGIIPKGNPLTRKLAFRKHIRRLRLLLENLGAGVIVSTDYAFTIAAWLAAGSTGKKIYAWEHHHFHWLKKSRFWNYLYRKIYPRLESVICLNTREEELFRDFGCRTMVIPNFIEPAGQRSHSAKTLLTIGWLIRRKGVDLIPDIAEKVFARFPEWNWRVIGSGEEKTHMLHQIAAKGLKDRFEIQAPSTNDPGALYGNASLYIMTSRFECFPMVLLEAMSFGLPCIAFDCPSGPADIIRDQQDGLLVEPGNTEAMAAAIMGLIDDEEKRKRMAEQAIENIKRFSPEHIYQLWKQLTG